MRERKREREREKESGGLLGGAYRFRGGGLAKRLTHLALFIQSAEKQRLGVYHAQTP
jgi:hypothetical protein